MPDMRSPDGTRWQTEDLPSKIEPVFCSQCGGRIGWGDTSFCADEAVLYCEDCTAENTNSEDWDE